MKHDDITERQIVDANRKFDAQFPHFLKPGARIRCAWNLQKLATGGKITDHKIHEYSTKGFYSMEMSKARSAYQARRRWFHSL
jgi:hypothetical protein